VGIKDELRALAELQRSLPDKRAALVDRARLAGMTWREIAKILDMTEQGLIKADRAWRERGKPQG
jgi:DNA-directed RNA polymerase specialized sigma24 family protein